jgi:carbon monoxide dehydrogenase subunit G
MQFENHAVVPASAATLWDFLMDIKAVSGCLPGVENVQEVDPDTYQANLKMRVGPIGLKFDGRMKVVERDHQNRRAVMRAEGNDKGVGGAVTANIVMTLVEQSPASTELIVKTDANVLGKLGEFGQPVMRKKADSMMQDFAKNISKQVVARSGA